MLTSLLKSFDTFVIIATTSSSITLSLTRIDLIVLLIQAVIACGLTISDKVIYEIIMQKYSKNKKQIEKDQQTFKSSDNLHR